MKDESASQKARDEVTYRVEENTALFENEEGEVALKDFFS